MNKGRVVLVIVLAVLMAWAWMSYLKKSSGREQEYSQYVQNAEELAGKKLYQKSLQEYERAFGIREDEESREAWLEVFRLAVEDGVKSEGEYEEAILNFCNLFPQRLDKWEFLVSKAINRGSYSDARVYYLKSVKAGVTSEKLEEYKDVIYYSYAEWGRAVSVFTPSTSGKFLLYRC